MTCMCVGCWLLVSPLYTSPVDCLHRFSCTLSLCRMKQGCFLATLIQLYSFAMQLDFSLVDGLQIGN